jgi:hypothetical protein
VELSRKTAGVLRTAAGKRSKRVELSRKTAGGTPPAGVPGWACRHARQPARPPRKEEGGHVTETLQ